MKIEEQFPELEELTFQSKRGKIIGLEQTYADCVDCSDVQAYCLSKQRVKEAIEKTANKFNSEHLVKNVYYELGYLLKELGLEE